MIPMPPIQEPDHMKKEASSGSEMSTSIPMLSLPKGGGALKGIGETFSANPVTGTGSLRVPIFTTPSRSDFSPKLALSYDSGAGNGIFGMGWSLSIPSITRKTEKGLPRYQDAAESDIYILSEAEDLVPALVSQGDSWTRDVLPGTIGTEQYTVQRYRPRVEGIFARIERWESNQTGEVYWRSISKDNITSIYGRDTASRVADPEDSRRIFKWLLTESFDDKGNAILYQYKQENSDNIDPALPQEQHRSANGSHVANHYVKCIYYGNKTPRQPGNTSPPLQPDDWLFQVVFDYGEHGTGDPSADNPTVDEEKTWGCRQDPFSSFRSCFEMRTYRLCRRVLIFHNIQELGVIPCLVCSTDFTYKAGPITSYLTSVAQTGYILRTEPEKGYAKEAFPSLDFTYSEPQVDEQVYNIDAESVANLPVGLDDTHYQWIDVESEGIPGILTEQADAWWYKRNLGNAQFAPVALLATKPSVARLQSGQQHITDLAGDGHSYLVQFAPPLGGFYELEEDDHWGPFTPFLSSPHIAWDDPNLKFIDLDGDGHADILISEDDVFVWHQSRAREGFGPAETVHKTYDEEKGPALVFADAMQSIYLADMTGDGLTDIVRIRNGEICYWPNKGYGQFSSKVTMDAAPLFDYPDYFDQKRLRLADIDGSGTTDIIYLDRNTVTFWFNQSGNSWSQPHVLANFPTTDDLSAIMVIDLFGNGTACLVWSSSLPADARQPMRYIDLMGRQKPHLLLSINNNMGHQTNLQYAASTKFYLEDRQAGTPWLTKLPFPVHVVERIETCDAVSETTLVTIYRYHHGFYDGVEREFRGFGLVEQCDTESFAQFKNAALPTTVRHIIEDDLYVPPVYTKTWFHTGMYLKRETISRHFADEYYQGDPQAPLLPDTTLPSKLTAPEEREAYRALNGKILRQEIYAQDVSPHSSDPYSVTEHTYAISRIQPLLDNPYGVFYVNEQESLELHYERQPSDPRINHRLTLEIDAFGNVAKSATIGYPRRFPTATGSGYPEEQTSTLMTYTEADFINKADRKDFYRIGVPSEARTYEIIGILRPQEASSLFTVSSVLTQVQNASTISYEVQPSTGIVQKRRIEHTQTRYYKDDLSGVLSLGQVESHALPYQTYKEALTPGLITQVYGGRVNDTLLASEGGYLQQDGGWWVPSGKHIYDPLRFYLPVQFIDPFGNTSYVTYDVYALLTTQTEDPLQNVVRAENNYRTMLPEQITDPNKNRSAALFDALGMVTATAVMGKDGQNEGDTLTDPTTRLEYNLFNWVQNQRPNYVHTFAREQHGAANPRWQETYTYSDGSGREAMKKIQAEPGPALTIDAQGNLITVDTSPQVRWVGTGRTIYDNKGNPAKKYEPYFSATPEYETEQALVERGVTPILHYDPIGRLVRIDNPNGTFSRVEFDAWQQVTWDENDTVLESAWYTERQALDKSDPEYRAAQLAATHANTPGIAYLDVLGRVFLTIADNGPDGKYPTHVTLDIEGNQRVITDARGNQAMVNAFDMLKRKLAIHSMDAGEHEIVQNAVDLPVREWDSFEGDSQGHQIRHRYDALHRPTHLFVQQGADPEALAELIVYGESYPNAVTLNLRGKPYQHYDGAGVVTNNHYDFKGNLLSSSRQLAKEYRQQISWIALNNIPDVRSIARAAANLLEPETFLSSTTYDALNRPTSITIPDNSEVRPAYNEANLLEKLDVRLRGAVNTTPFINNLDYNARGQREFVEYANKVNTSYIYDPLTFRMTRLKTIRTTDHGLLQDLSYTYDPVGNITEIRDDAQQTLFFNNARVAPTMQYVYDALYWLAQASGREHVGQNITPPPHSSPEYDYNDAFRTGLPHPNDGKAMHNYTEQYQYDPAGNILKMVHSIDSTTAWTRHYAYTADSNRLHSTSLPGDSPAGPFSALYNYDIHGNITKMYHLPQMQWDFKNQLQQVDLGGGGTAYYAYDTNGQRVRKVVQNGSLIKEHIYLGGYEIFRQSNGSGLTIERETLHIMDDKRRISLVETQTINAGQPVTSPSSLSRYQLGNHLDSATIELDKTGAIISYEEYYPYGNTSYQAGRSMAEVSLKRYRYTGKERDEETGLYYYGARYYAPWLGRWTSCDPVLFREPQKDYKDYHPYIYVQDRPTVAVDSDGRAINLLAAAIGAGAGALIGGGIEAGRQLWSGGKISSWKHVGAAVAGGSAAGLVAGLTMGGSLLVEAGMAGTASVAGGAVTRAVSGEKQSVAASTGDFAVGVVTFGIVRGGSAVVRSIASKLRGNTAVVTSGAAESSSPLAQEISKPSIKTAPLAQEGAAITPEATSVPSAKPNMAAMTEEGVAIGKQGKTFITYVLRDAKGEVRYIGRASGKGTAEEVLAARFSKGHKYGNVPGLVPEVIAVQGSKEASQGAEGVWYEYFKKEGANLLNDLKSPPLSDKLLKLPDVKRKIDIYAKDLLVP